MGIPIVEDRSRTPRVGPQRHFRVPAMGHLEHTSLVHRASHAHSPALGPWQGHQTLRPPRPSR